MHQVETILKAMNPAAKIRKTKLGAVDISPKTWTKGRLLGRGSFGSVYQAYSSDGFVFAAKEVSLLDQESPGRSCVYQLQQEIEFLSWLEHKNIIQYYGSFEYGSNLYMCMEHAPNGSIQRLYQGSNLSYPRVSKYTKEILLGLNYLHGHNVVHRDIKCANILVDAYGSAKLADFGLAKITTKMNELQSLQGTAFWMAPEVLSAKMKNQGYGSPADIWSLGCTVLEMLTRQVPYPGLEPFQAFFKIAMGELPHVPHFLCKEARDFIHQCLQVNPNNRPTAAQLLCHPFVTSGPKKLPHLLDHLDGLFIQMKAKKLYARECFVQIYSYSIIGGMEKNLQLTSIFPKESMAILYLKWRKTSASQVENKLDISIQFLTLFLRLMPQSSRPMDISKITEENISNMIMVKLNRSNYTLWRLRFLRVLKKYKVYGLVEGSDSCLPAFVINSRGYITDVINPAYDIWMERDRIVKLWLTSTITEDLLHNMAGKTSAMDLWLTLEKRSLGAARSHTHDQLRSQLETISKGNMSMNEYLQQIKQLGDGLAAVGAPIYGVELIQYVLNGLPEEYEPFVIDTVLRVHRTSIDELSNLLLNKEGYMVQNRMSPTSPEPLHGQANVLEICPVGTRAEIKLAAMNFSPNSWRRGQLLGRGTFGSVYQGFSENGLRFAVKEVSLLDQGSQGRKCLHQLQQEISLLSRLQHENIIQYYGSYEHESNLYMYMELAPHGSLRKYYQTCHLSGPRVSVYTKKILLGLKYLHDQNVVHRDIKCSNILVDANRSVKLADFGLAKITKMNDIQSLQGSVFWMAPEVVNANMINQGYGLPADIWSLGCTVLETFTGRVPYHNLEWCQALFKIGKGEPPKVPDSLPKDAQDFIHKCLQVNPNDRLTAAQLLDHPFVNMPLINPTSPRLPTIFDDVQHYKGIYRCAFNPESCTKLK